MCCYALDVSPGNPSDTDCPSYNGDRIIVNKFAYDVGEPQRWDVVVFKFPEKATINYIKRLVGLPGERIQINDGDIYTSPLNESDFHIARKSPEKLRATLQPVYDNNFVVPELIKAGLAPRWQPWVARDGLSPWKVSADYKSFSVESPFAERMWLRYQHILPADIISSARRYNVWQDLRDSRPISSPPPQLITDFYAYNDGDFFGNDCRRPIPDPHWVGDLAVDCQADVKLNQGALTLELVKGGVKFRCRIALDTGIAALSISSLPDFAPTAKTIVRGPGSYSLSFANVDEQLYLWVNGTPVTFDSPTTYPPLNNHTQVTTAPVPGSGMATDLSPVGIGVDSGAKLDISQLKIWRDIYYLLGPGATGSAGRTYDLQADQFFMLGDNSPESSDSRYWNSQKYVDRRLLVGKALFVYWPHSFNQIEIGSLKIPFPLWPNFSRMRFVR
jgi:signal peptidase I